MRTSTNILYTLLCLLFLTGSCRNSVLDLQNIELNQDINMSGIVDISSVVNFSITPSETNIRFRPNRYWLGLGAADKFGIRFINRSGGYVEAGYDAFREIFYVNAFSYFEIEQYSINEAEMIDMRIILNNASVELSSMDGKIVITDRFLKPSKFNKIELFAENGRVFVESISIKQLKRK